MPSDERAPMTPKGGSKFYTATPASGGVLMVVGTTRYNLHVNAPNPPPPPAGQFGFLTFTNAVNAPGDTLSQAACSRSTLAPHPGAWRRPLRKRKAA